MKSLLTNSNTLVLLIKSFSIKTARYNNWKLSKFPKIVVWCGQWKVGRKNSFSSLSCDIFTQFSWRLHIRRPGIIERNVNSHWITHCAGTDADPTYQRASPNGCWWWLHSSLSSYDVHCRCYSWIGTIWKLSVQCNYWLIDLFWCYFYYQEL